MENSFVFIATLSFLAFFLIKEASKSLSLPNLFSETVRENKKILFLTALTLILPFLMSRLILEISILNSTTSYNGGQQNIMSIIVGIITTASSIFIGNSILQRSQRLREEEKAICDAASYLIRISRKLRLIGILIINSFSGNQKTHLGIENVARISSLCNDSIQCLIECRTISAQIQMTPGWYLFSMELDAIEESLNSLKALGFRESEDEVGVELNQAVLLFLEVVFPLEIKIYDFLIDFERYINQDYWQSVKRNIINDFQGENIKSRDFLISKFIYIFNLSCKLESRPGIKNFSPEYMTSKLHGERVRILNRLGVHSEPSEVKTFSDLI